MVLSNWRSWRIGRSGAPEFVGLVLVGVFMAAVAAFGSREMPPLLRYGYWLTVIPGGGLIGALIEPWLEKVPWLASRPPVFAAAQAVVMTPPITALTHSTTTDRDRRFSVSAGSSPPACSTRRRSAA